MAGLGALALLVGGAVPAGAATSVLYAAPTATGAADCASPAGACTIGVAVSAANAASVTDDVRIRLAGGVYDTSAPTPTALDITFAGPSLTLEATEGTATLDGGGVTRVLTVAASSHVTLEGLTIRAGWSGNLGGAVDNLGELTLRHATLSGNAAQNGGAIFNRAGARLTVEDSTLEGNTAAGVGGGALLDGGTTTVERSLVVGNAAPVNGGGINVQPGATTTISGSTLADNRSGSLGGAFSSLGTLTVQSSTIADNTASEGAAVGSGNPNTTFAAVLVAAQRSGTACGPAGTPIIDAGYNVDTDGSCVSEIAPAVGSHSGGAVLGSSTYGATLDAFLADDLLDNGGPTRTLALLLDPVPATTVADPLSAAVPPDYALPAAVDGASTVCAARDQRGARPLAGVPCSIGAFQQLATRTALGASAGGVEQDAPVTYTATVTPTAAGGTVAFDDGPGNPASTRCAAQPVSAGTATCTVEYAGIGEYRATATYSGDRVRNSHRGSTSAEQAVVVATRPAVTVPVAPQSPSTPSTPPAPDPVSPAPVVRAPVLATLGMTRCVGSTNRAQRRGAGSYRVGAPSRVTLTLQRRVGWPRVAPASCPEARSTGAPGSTGRYVAVRGPAPRASGRVVVLAAGAARELIRTVSVAAGTHRFSLASLLGSTTLRPGRYRVLVQATGPTGATTQRSIPFWVLRPASAKPAR